MKETNMIAAIDNKMDKHIITFMKEQTVMTVATASDDMPHCATCFYVFVEEENLLVFKSKPSTRHINEGRANPHVAGSILPDKFIPGKTSGIQFKGVFGAAMGPVEALAAKQYYKKYPFAAVMPGDIWIIELTSIVFTDATLGFGKKRLWAKTL